MVSFVLVCLIVLILIVIVIFHSGVFLDFISPSALQVQLLGVNITLVRSNCIVGF